MQVLPIHHSINSKQTSFQGEFKTYHIDMYNHYRFEDHLCGGSYPPIYGRDNDVLKHIDNFTHPNSKIETVSDTFHRERLNNIYFADPMEVVGDDIRKNADFIVHDAEPKYPNPDKISDSYFGASQRIYDEDFKTIRDYYYRLEMADRKTLAKYENNQMGNLSYKELTEKIDYYKDRIAKSQYQQWQAEECRNKYNNARKLLNEKFNLCNKYNMYKRSYDNAPKYINNMNHSLSELETKKQDNSNLINILKDKIANLSEVIKINESLDKKSEEGSKLKYVKNEIPHLENYISNTKEELENSRKTKMAIIKDIENYKRLIAEQEQCLIELPEKISSLEVNINKIKERLIPLFDELKHFYAKQRIIK